MEIFVLIYFVIAVLFFLWAIVGMEHQALLVVFVSLVWPVTLIMYFVEEK